MKSIISINCKQQVKVLFCSGCKTTYIIIYNYVIKSTMLEHTSLEKDQSTAET